MTPDIAPAALAARQGDGAARIMAVNAPITDRQDGVQVESARQRLNHRLEEQATRIAHALHDEAAQLLTSAYLSLDDARRSVPDPAHAHLQAVKQCLDQIEAQFRRLAHELRPGLLADRGLVPALEFLVKGVESRWGISVRIEASVDQLPANVETVVYRVVQEALMNAAKHAHASHVRIGLLRSAGLLQCSIEDDGLGFNDAVVDPLGERGFGLTSIREQVWGLGGTFQILSNSERGARLSIEIPLEN